MHFFRFVLVLGVAGILGACAIDYAGKTPGDIAQKVKVSDSEFDKSRTLMAPELMGDGAGALGPIYRANLVALQNKATGAVQHHLHVLWMYSSNDWMFFNQATLSGGVDLLTVVGRRNVTNCSGRICSYEEVLTAAVPADVLSGATEVKVRFASSRGYAMVTLPANYVAGYRQGVSSATGKQ